MLQAEPLCTLPRETGPVTITMELFEEVVGLAAKIPVSHEIERYLAASFKSMSSDETDRRVLVTSYKDVAAIRTARNPNHVRAKTDEQFRTGLVVDVLQYVSSALQTAALAGSLSGADERIRTSAAGFRAALNEWVQAVFLPSVRGRLPDGMLSPLLAAARDWCGQLQITPPSLGATAASPETGGGASMLAAARRHQPLVPAIGASAGPCHQRSVPAARRLAFGQFQHLPDRCEKCAAECKSVRSRFMCSCGAIRCKACYGLARSDANKVTGYQCDACREEHNRVAVVFPREGYNFCFACTAELPPSLEIQSCCPGCRCRFCQRCAAVAMIELQNSARKRVSDGSSVIGQAAGSVALLCPTCAGSEKYEEGREAVCSMLLTKILRGGNYERMQWAKLTYAQLKSSKDWADALGDLLYDLFFHGFRDVFAKYLPHFLNWW